MAKCPKCGRRLRPIDWKPNCPECGVNLIFYDFEERFYTDAKVAEMSLASVRVKFQRVKVGLIGGKLQVARLICSLLPLAALLLPFCSFKLDIGIYQKNFSLSIINIYTAITDGTFSLLKGLTDAPDFGTTAASIVYPIFGFAAVAVVDVLILAFTILCFISFKKMATGINVLSAAGLCLCILTQALAMNVMTDGAVIARQAGYGCIAAAAAYVIVFFVNLPVARNGIAVDYKPGDLERVAIKSKVKKGEVLLSELPFPVVQSEEVKPAPEAAMEGDSK